MKKIPKSGDIFKFQINKGEFAFGRILLNIETLFLESGLIQPTNPLTVYNNRHIILVELFRETSVGNLPIIRSILIPSILTNYDFISLGMWSIVGFEPVNPLLVDFPEGLTSISPVKSGLVKGELTIPFNMDMNEVQKIGIYPGTKASVTFPEITLYHLDRKDEINNPRLIDKEVMNTKKDDLRFSEHRQKIYDLAGLDPNESYYSLSKRMGFDLARFY